MRLPTILALVAGWVLLGGYLLEPLTPAEHTILVYGVLLPCVPFVLVTRERRG